MRPVFPLIAARLVPRKGGCFAVLQPGTHGIGWIGYAPAADLEVVRPAAFAAPSGERLDGDSKAG